MHLGVRRLRECLLSAYMALLLHCPQLSTFKNSSCAQVNTRISIHTSFTQCQQKFRFASTRTLQPKVSVAILTDELCDRFIVRSSPQYFAIESKTLPSIRPLQHLLKLRDFTLLHDCCIKSSRTSALSALQLSKLTSAV